jgi:RNA recognition motif-containing protein
MSKKIYVGNLSFDSSEDQLRNLFAQYGTVGSVNVIMDRDTGRSRGFGFVEMETGGDDAIRSLDKQDLDGRSLNVNEARPRESRVGGRQPRW